MESNYIINTNDIKLQKSYKGGNNGFNVFIIVILTIILYIIYYIYTTYVKKSDFKDVITVISIIKKELDLVKTHKTNLSGELTKTSNNLVKSALPIDENHYIKKYDDLLKLYKGKVDAIDSFHQSNMEKIDASFNNKLKSFDNSLQDKKKSIDSLIENKTILFDSLFNTKKTQLENILKQYQDKLNKLSTSIVNNTNEISNNTTEIIPPTQKIDNAQATQDIITMTNTYKNKYDELLTNYENKIIELDSKYTQILNLRDERNLQLENIKSSVETASKNLKAKKDEYIAELNAIITNTSTDIKLNKEEMKKIKEDYNRITIENESILKNIADSVNKSIDNINLETLEQLFVSGNVTIGTTDKAFGSKISIYAGHNKGGSINFLDPYGDSDVWITGKDGVISIKNGDLNIDNDTLIQGKLQVNKNIEVNKVKLSNKLNSQNLLEPGLLTISGVSAEYPGAIQFTDRDGNPQLYIAGFPSGLFINNNIEAAGYMTIAAYEETPAQLVFKDNKGNAKAYIQLEGENINIQNDLELKKGAKILGDLEVNGNFTLLNTLNGNTIKTKFVEIDNDLLVKGNTAVMGTMVITDNLTAHSLSKFNNGIEIIGSVDIKPNNKLPANIKLKAAPGSMGYVQFDNAGGVEIAKIQATANGLTITNKGLTVDQFALIKKGIKSFGTIDVGEPGYAGPWNGKISMWGGSNSNYIEFMSNRKNESGKYNRQAYIQGMGQDGGGLLIAEGPVSMTHNLNVAGNSSARDGSFTGNLNVSGNIVGSSISSKNATINNNFVVERDGTINGKLIVNGEGGIESLYRIKTGGFLESGMDLDVGARAEAIEGSILQRGILNINSSYSKYGSIYFTNRSRAKVGEITTDSTSLIIDALDLAVKQNIKVDGTLTSTGIVNATGGINSSNHINAPKHSIIGSHMKSHNNIQAGNAISGQYINASKDITANGNLNIKGESTLTGMTRLNGGVNIKSDEGNPYINFYSGQSKTGSIYTTPTNTVIDTRIKTPGIDSSGSINSANININTGDKLSIKHPRGYIEWLNAAGQRSAYLQTNGGLGNGITLKGGPLTVENQKLTIKHNRGFIEWLNTDNTRAAFLKTNGGNGGGATFGGGPLSISNKLDVSGDISSNSLSTKGDINIGNILNIGDKNTRVETNSRQIKFVGNTSGRTNPHPAASITVDDRYPLTGSANNYEQTKMTFMVNTDILDGKGRKGKPEKAMVMYGDHDKAFIKTRFDRRNKSWVNKNSSGDIKCPDNSYVCGLDLSDGKVYSAECCKFGL